MIQDLRNLAELAKVNKGKLKAINYDYNLIEQCNQEADLQIRNWAALLGYRKDDCGTTPGEVTGCTMLTLRDHPSTPDTRDVYDVKKLRVGVKN